jgi:seryl-tRNA synthetase
LDEVLGYRVDWIEHQLAHAVKDPNGRAYNRTAHLDARRRMMQKWADYLDKLRQGLQQRLEEALGRAEARWGQDRFESLRLAAQKLADQLTAVEELEERLRRQLEPDQGH